MVYDTVGQAESWERAQDVLTPATGRFVSIVGTRPGGGFGSTVLGFGMGLGSRHPAMIAWERDCKAHRPGVAGGRGFRSSGHFTRKTGLIPVIGSLAWTGPSAARRISFDPTCTRT